MKIKELLEKTNSTELELVESYSVDVDGQLEEGLISSLFKHATSAVKHKVSSAISSVKDKVHSAKHKIGVIAAKHETAASHLHVLDKAKSVHKIARGTAAAKEHFEKHGMKHIATHHDEKLGHTVHHVSHGGVHHTIVVNHKTGTTHVHTLHKGNEEHITHGSVKQ